MVSALNFKAFSKGTLVGFFDLQFHSLTVKGCRLMDGKNGLWVALPQKEGKKDGEPPEEETEDLVETLPETTDLSTMSTNG